MDTDKKKELYEVKFEEDHLSILKNNLYWHLPPELIKKAFKLSDISEELFYVLSEEQTDAIYYFFFDLETKG